MGFENIPKTMSYTISPNSPGGVVLLIEDKWIETGYKLQAITATIAATKLVNKNIKMIVLYLEPIPDFALEIADATKIKTKIGAIALRVFTNISPGKPIMDHSGTRTPKIPPITNPIKIFKTRLDSVHFLIKSNFIPL